MTDSSDTVSSSLKLAVRYPIRSFLAALRFLTIIPVSWKSADDGKFFRASVIWFPLIGLFIGFSVAMLILLLSPCLPGSVLAVFSILLLAGVSGFLHLDGLADSGDGLLSSRPKDIALSIMRDSRSGAMGVIVLIFLILAKFAVLSSLTMNTLIPTLILMPVAGRTAILLSMAVLPYAREGEGLGQLFYGTDRFTTAGTALLFFLLCSAIISMQLTFFILIALVFTVAVFSRYCFVKLGGATGDTLGAVCEISELTVALAALLQQGVP